MSKPIYIPSAPNCGTDWWSDKAPWEYNYVLISAGLMNGKSVKRAFPEMRDDMFIMGDSGGFQQATQGVRFSAIDIMKWLENNTSVGFILDLPPIETTGNSGLGKQMDSVTFEKRLELTIKNVETMMETRTKDDFQLYAVLQGKEKEDMQLWYDGLKDFDFVNWGISPKTGKAKDCVEMALFLRERGAKNVHVLGVSHMKVSAVLAYISDYFDVLSYDSRKWASGTMYGTYWNPYMRTYAVDMMKREGGEPGPVCDCPYCRKMEEDGINMGDMINGHNVYWMVQESTIQYNLLKINEKMWMDKVIIPNDKNGEIRDVLNFARKALDLGLEEAGGQNHGFW